MSKAATKPKRRSGPPPGRRRPVRRQSALRQRLPWLVGAAVATLAVVLVVVSAGGGDDGSATGSFVGGDLHTLAVDPSSPDRLFVGGHQGVAASSDGGRRWSQVASLENADAMGWAFLDGEIWMSGHPGLRRSTDGGRRFDPAGGRLENTDVHALGGAGGVLYAASPAEGLLASTDRGRSWVLRSAQAGRGFMGSMLVDPADPDHVVAPDMQQGCPGEHRRRADVAAPGKPRHGHVRGVGRR